MNAMGNNDISPDMDEDMRLAGLLIFERPAAKWQVFFSALWLEKLPGLIMSGFKFCLQEKGNTAIIIDKNRVPLAHCNPRGG